MAVYDLEEQEKIDALKAWWKEYGNWVSAALLAGALAVGGIQGWRWYQRNQAEQAGVLYQAISEALGRTDLPKARDAADQLLGKFGGTAYAPRGALLLARAEFEAGERASAKARLGWVVEHAAEDTLRQIARLRLAQVLLDDKQYDEALRTLDAKHDDSIAGLYADLRGDILVAAGKPAEARAAYAQALAKLDPKGGYRNVVQVKLDAVGGAP